MRNEWFCTQTTPGLGRTTQVSHMRWFTNPAYKVYTLKDRGIVQVYEYTNWIFACLPPDEQTEFLGLEYPNHLAR